MESPFPQSVSMHLQHRRSETPSSDYCPVVPALVVSGINYGENLGACVTISGTVGAALEAASFGVPAIAASLETDERYHFHPSY